MTTLNLTTKRPRAMSPVSPFVSSFVAATAVVVLLAFGHPSRADLTQLSSSGTSTDASSDATTAGSSLWRLPHQGTRRDKSGGSGNLTPGDSTGSTRPTDTSNDPSDFTIQDQSLGYQSLYAGDDFQNLGGAGWVQTEQPPLADGEDSSLLRLTTAPVPLPGAVWLGALGLGSIAWIRRRFGA